MTSLRVELYPPLRDAAGVGSLDIELEDGATVGGLLEALVARFGPEFRRHLFDTDGRFIPSWNVIVNNEIVQMNKPEAPGRALSSGDDVAIIMNIAGGQRRSEIMSQVEVLYGDDVLRFEVPEANLAGVIEPRLPAPIADVARAVAKALENPVAGPKFSELIGPGKKVAILSDNFARPTPAHQILPAILEAIKKAGAEPRIIIGNGGIREMTEEELERKLGADILDSSVPVIQSQAKKKDDFEFIGVTRYGTPVAVNRYFLECDASIRVGTTQLNLWSGYGGGGSIILPGVASFETIEWNHRLITARGSQIGTTMPENVMHADIEDAARLAGLNMSVDVILNPKWEVLDVQAGECVATHASSIRRYNELYGYKAVGLGGRPGDIGISGSFPWDFYFAHACWSIATLDKVIKDGGTIIVASPSLGGLAHFAHVAEYMPPNRENQGRLLNDVFYGKQELWHAALWYPIYEVMMRKRVFVVTGEKNMGAFTEAGIKPFATMEEALAAAMQKQGQATKVLVAPYGKWTVASL